MGDALLFEVADRDQYLLVVVRHDFLEAREEHVEVLEDLCAELRLRLLHIIREDVLQLLDVILLGNLQQGNHVLVELEIERVIHIEDVGDTTGHTGGEVLTGRSEDDGTSTGHVLETMIATALGNRRRTGITNAEALTGDTIHIALAGRRTIEGDVADDDILTGAERTSLRWRHDELTAAQALTEAIIGITMETDREALRDKRTKGLTAATVCLDHEGIIRQGIALRRHAVVIGDLGAEDGTEGTVRARNLDLLLVVLTARDGRGKLPEKHRLVEGLLEMEIIDPLRIEVTLLLRKGRIARIQDLREIHLCRARGDMRGRSIDREAVGTADHLVHGTEAELRHVLAHLLCDEAHEVHDVLRLAREALAENVVLGSDTERAGILVADTHHHAAEADERCCREAILLRTEQCGDDDVATGHQLTIGLELDTVTKPVLDQRMVRLRDTELPRETRMVDRGHRCCTGTSIVAGHEDDLCAGLRNTTRDGADAVLRNELDGDRGTAVRVLQVIDQLCQILDAVDIVVRWRGNERHTRGRETGLGNPRIDLLTRQVAALTRLRALRHLDLDLDGGVEVGTGYTETAGRNLLDSRIPLGTETVRMLTTLTGIRLAAETVHRDGHRLVRLLRNRAVGHRTGLEALHDGGYRLDLLDRHRLVLRGELHEAAQRMRTALVVDPRGVLLKQLIVAFLAPNRTLKRDDGLRVVEVILGAPTRAQLVEADGIERGIEAKPHRIERVVMPGGDALGDVLYANAADPRHGTGEVLLHQLFT